MRRCTRNGWKEKIAQTCPAWLEGWALKSSLPDCFQCRGKNAGCLSDIFWKFCSRSPQVRSMTPPPNSLLFYGGYHFQRWMWNSQNIRPSVPWKVISLIFYLDDISQINSETSQQGKWRYTGCPGQKWLHFLFIIWYLIYFYIDFLIFNWFDNIIWLQWNGIIDSLWPPLHGHF